MDASRIFERIAKEGRKYGLFLLVASQRPSELSKTVLSQCSNFVVHRIQNPDDLFQIRQMTPFISESVLKRLPSLPKQHALVFGTSVNLPTTFRVRDAAPLPASTDARIRELWYHEAARKIAPIFPAKKAEEPTPAPIATTDSVKTAPTDEHVDEDVPF
jgi:DNA helicase HerA-like ATPase